MTIHTQTMATLLAQLRDSRSVTTVPRSRELAAPVMLEAALQLDPGRVLDGAAVRVAFEGMLDTDLVALVLFGKPGAGTPEIEPINGDARGYVDFKVPVAAIDANDGTAVTLMSALVRGEQQWLSPPVDLMIARTRQAVSALALPAPVLHALENHNLIPAAVSSSGQSVTVAAYPDMRSGDKVRVIWTGITQAGSYSTAVQTATGRTALTFTVPKSVVDANGGASASVAYAVRRGTGEAEQMSAAVPFKLMNLVDTSTLKLDGMAIRVAANWPRTGVEYPGNSAKRTGSGGKGPYAYSTSAPAIASVDKQGTVIGLKNGRAVITVTDAAKVKVQYPVEVSNVWELLLRSTTSNHDAAVAWMNGQRGIPLHETQLISLYYRWPYPGDINKNLYWLCTGEYCAATNGLFWNGDNNAHACHGRGVNLRALCKRAY